MIRNILFTLTLSGVTAACGNLDNDGPVQNAGISEPLFNTEWVLAGFDTSAENGRSASAPMIIFGMEENRIFGSGGCNRYSGAYELGSDNSIRFQNVISTKMACPEMDHETDYFNKLNHVRTYTISEDFSELMLRDGTGEILLTYVRTAIRRT